MTETIPLGQAEPPDTVLTHTDALVKVEFTGDQPGSKSWVSGVDFQGTID